MRIWLALALCASISAPAGARPVLDPLFGDHAVIQRDRPIHVRGRAHPGERVSVRLARVTRATTADASGAWSVTLPALPAGGPFALTATGAGGEAATARGLLAGDVWLCSGQSNMEWPLRRAMGGDDEAANASDDRLRILTVPQRTSLDPEPMLPADVRWQTVTPETAPHFSAACYFMGKDLRASSKVAVGLINSSWGGTRIRPWMDESAARATGGAADAELMALHRRDPAAAARAFGEQWGAWWRQQISDAEGQEPWRNSTLLKWKPFEQINYWENWKSGDFADFNGLVWARQRFTLTPEQAAKAATLSLGVIDDFDQTWVNGIGVGSSFGWSLERNYRLPAGLLKAGQNEIVVSIGDSWGLGGFQGPAEKLRLTFADGQVVPLGKGWDYSVMPNSVGAPPRAPWESHTGLSVIYNAMIAPIGPFGLKGVAWYQGESDVGIRGYSGRLAAMMASWRQQFAQPRLPFLIVALAGFGRPSSAPAASGWAELIDAQRRAAAADAAAALVVATDLGEPGDIHPLNKTDVGRRLALAARRIAYGETKVAPGPTIRSATRTGDGVLVAFAGVSGSLKALSSAKPIGFEMCAETQASCRYADASIAGSTVVLAGDGRPATRVRYAWSDYPVMNLYDDAQLPPPPFEIPIN